MNPTLRSACFRLLPALALLGFLALWQYRPRPVPTPAQQLTSSQAETRRAAVETLVQQGPTAIRALVSALPDKDEIVQRLVARALLQCGPAAVPELTTALQHSHRTARFRAACLLNQLDAANTAPIPVLIDAFQERLQHRDATAALVRIGTPAVPALGAALQHTHPGVRLGAAATLRELGPTALPVASALTVALRDEQREVRQAAIRALAATGVSDAGPVSALLECLADVDARVRNEATAALVLVGPRGVPALAAALTHPEAPVRRGAARALAQLGPAGVPALEALVACLRDADLLTQQEAALAVAQLGGRAEAVPVLFPMLQSTGRRYEAQQALMKCGPVGVKALTAALTDGDPVIRGESARSLGEMGAPAQAAVPALIGCLQDKDRSVRREAAHALGRIGADAETSVPALVIVLRDPWPVNRGEAAIALQRFGPQGRAAVPALVAALKDDSLDASREAAKALVEIGPAAVPDLRQALTAPDEALRQRAQEVLKQIERNEQ